MTFLNLIGCAGIAFGPHVVAFRGTRASESRTTALVGGAAYLAAQFAKLLLLGLLLVPTSTPSDPVLVACYAVLVVADIAAMHFALSRFTSGPSDVRVLSFGIGWAITESLCTRLPAMWVGSRAMDWSWSHIVSAFESPLALVSTVAVVALVLARGKATTPRARHTIEAACVAILALPDAFDGLASGMSLPGGSLIPFAFRAAVTAGAVVVARPYAPRP